MIPKSDLSEADYKILKYLSNHSPAAKEDIISKLSPSVEAIEYRLQKLTVLNSALDNNDGYIVQSRETRCAKPGGMPVDFLKNEFCISDIGKSALQDYRITQKHSMRILWLKSVWLPILVSFVTTNLTMHIVPRLPLILKWFSDFLSKIFS